MKTFYVSEITKVHIKEVIYISLNIILAVIIPLPFFFHNINLNISEILSLKIRILTTFTVIMGVVTTGSIIFKFRLNKLSIFPVLSTVFIQISYCIYIFIWSEFWEITISLENLSLLLNLSSLTLFLYPIPILIIVKALYSYIVNYNESKLFSVVLSIIKNNKFNSKNQIIKIFNKKLDSKYKLKLKGKFGQLIDKLENKKPPLIKKSNKYYITKEGKELINWFNKDKKKPEKLKIPKYEEVPLQMWTEEDLKKLKNG